MIHVVYLMIHVLENLKIVSVTLTVTCLVIAVEILLTLAHLVCSVRYVLYIHVTVSATLSISVVVYEALVNSV